MNTGIADLIIDLKKKDLRLWDELINSGKLSDDYNEVMEELHNQHAYILNDIIDKIGYPTPDKVGKEASEAAWLIIQHSIGQPAFMKKCRDLLQQVNGNEANPIHLAYLTDGSPYSKGSHSFMVPSSIGMRTVNYPRIAMTI
jgi:hypothetical protein